MKDTTLAKTLRALRRHRALDRAKVAADLGISYASLMSYEIGERVPGMDRMPAIASYYGMTVQDLFFPGCGQP